LQKFCKTYNENIKKTEWTKIEIINNQIRSKSTVSISLSLQCLSMGRYDRVDIEMIFLWSKRIQAFDGSSLLRLIRFVVYHFVIFLVFEIEYKLFLLIYFFDCSVCTHGFVSL